MTMPTGLRCASLVVFLTLGTAHAQGGDDALKNLPASVQKTIRAEGQQANIMSVEPKEKHGAVRYKVIMSLEGGKQRRLLVDNDGKLLKLKNDMDTGKLPAAVRKTVDAQAQGARLIRSTQVTQEGKVQYEAEFDASGRKKVVLIEPAGQLAKVEEDVPLTSIPVAAKSQVEKNIGRGKLLKVEAITKSGKPTVYEAQIEVDAHKSEIKVAPDGKVIERE